MIKADENNLGGRVRTARMGTHKKMKDFAGILGITPNYLGLIERGVKKPSPQLLQQISEKTDVSYTWLLNGPEEEQEKKKLTSPVHCTVASVNLQLLLSILMTKLSYDKELMAKFMGIGTEDIEKIITGGHYDFDPRWEGILSGLTQTIELTALMSQLERIIEFIRDKQEDKNNWKLYTSIKRYADKAHADAQYQLMGKIETEEEAFVYEDHLLHLFTKQITLISETAGKWMFKYYPAFDEPYSEFIGQFLDSQTESLEDRLSLIFDDEYIYHTFCRHYKDHHNMCDTDPAYDTDLGIQISSFILIDKETLEFVDTQTFAPNEPS